jgi:hypothetical protein
MYHVCANTAGLHASAAMGLSGRLEFDSSNHARTTGFVRGHRAPVTTNNRRIHRDTHHRCTRMYKRAYIDSERHPTSPLAYLSARLCPPWDKCLFWRALLVPPLGPPLGASGIQLQCGISRTTPLLDGGAGGSRSSRGPGGRSPWDAAPRALTHSGVVIRSPQHMVSGTTVSAPLLLCSSGPGSGTAGVHSLRT